MADPGDVVRRMRPYRRSQNVERRRNREHRRLRDDRDRRRPGGPERWLSPRQAEQRVRDPRRERACRRSVAQPLGLASPLHAGPLQRATRDAVRGAEVVVPDEGRDGRLPRGLCGTLRVAGASRDARRAGRAGGRPVRRVDRRRAARGAKCRRRDRRSRVPKLPPFAARLDPRIIQLHSSEYRNPSQLQDGPVLVVGVGNSGAEIALRARRDPSVPAGRRRQR